MILRRALSPKGNQTRALGWATIWGRGRGRGRAVSKTGEAVSVVVLIHHKWSVVYEPGLQSRDFASCRGAGQLHCRVPLLSCLVRRLPLPSARRRCSPVTAVTEGLRPAFDLLGSPGSRESLPCLRRRAWVDWESESGNGVAEVSHTPLRVSISRWLCTMRWLCLETVTIKAGWRRHSTLKPASSQHPAFVERLLPRGGGETTKEEL